MKIGFSLAIAGCLFAMGSVPALGQAVRSEVVAPNGVRVTVYSDDFAGRYEYTAPRLDLNGSSFALVAKVVEGGVAGKTMIIGSVYYDDDWRFYNDAIFRGGEKADANFNDRDVISCAGSRYGGCTHREGFDISISPEQVAKYGADSAIQIQLRAKRGDSFILSVPLNYMEAVEQVAKPSSK